MAKDTWYKRLGWFLFFSAITLLIFFVIDFAFNRFTEKYTENKFTASYVQTEYTFKKGDKIVLEIQTDASSYTVDVWINEKDTGLKFENENSLEINLEEELVPGVYKVQSSVFGKKGLGREREILIETTLIITE